MDYEKKYNEAVKELGNFLALLKRNGVANDDGIIETNLVRIFPELAESEDERIRKWLIDMIKRESGWTGKFPSQGQVLAYLEKQKTAEWSEDDENALEYLHGLIGFGFSENFMDAQTAADMRKWLNEKLKKYRP